MPRWRIPPTLRVLPALRVFPALIAAVLLLAAGPALAHRLKLFAEVDKGVVSGYGFFIGGGRAKSATIIFRRKDGTQLHRMQSDPEGSFRWKPAIAEDIRVILNAGDGHTAETTIAMDRLAPGTRTDAEPSRTAAPDASPTETPAPAFANEKLAELVERKVDQAVARQIKPLLEAYAKAEGRIRFNDVMGGIGMIIGLAGIALWATSRRRMRSNGRDTT